VAIFERGRAHWLTGQFREAAEDLQKTVLWNAEDPQLRFHTYALLGDSQRRTGRYDLATVNLTAALGYQEDAQVYLSRGLAYLEKKEHDRAVADFNEAIRLDPGIRTSVPAVPVT
jgi:tetratricopeptide (TPR) repeat protein